MSIELGTGSTENKLSRLARETAKQLDEVAESANKSAVSFPIVIPFHVKDDFNNPFLTTSQRYMEQAGLTDFIGRRVGSDDATISLRGLLNEEYLKGEKTLFVQGYFQVEGSIVDSWRLMWEPQDPAITDHCYMPIIHPADSNSAGVPFNVQVGFFTEVRTDFPDHFNVPKNLEVTLKTNGGNDAQSTAKGAFVIQSVMPCPEGNQYLIRT